MKKKCITFTAVLSILSLTLTGCDTTIQINIGKPTAESSTSAVSSDATDSVPDTVSQVQGTIPDTTDTTDDISADEAPEPIENYSSDIIENTPDGESDSQEYVGENPLSDIDTDIDETPYVDTADQTAPMPDTDLSEADLIGYWSPDINEAQPRILKFYYDDNGELRYAYYSILLGNGQGLNIANATTEFEYNKGKVVLNLEQGTCLCMVGDTDKAYITFYLSEMKDGTIYDQVKGKAFYRCESAE